MENGPELVAMSSAASPAGGGVGVPTPLAAPLASPPAPSVSLPLAVGSSSARHEERAEDTILFEWNGERRSTNCTGNA